MSVRGTAREHPPEPRRGDVPEFRSAGGLVRWHFGKGRGAMGGLKAISYDRDGGARDVFAMSSIHVRFALTTRCLAAVTDERQIRVLVLAYRHERSDLQIGERIGLSQETVRTARNRALRAVADVARSLGLMPEET